MVARKRKNVKRKRAPVRRVRRRGMRRRASKRRRLGGSGRQQTLQRLWGAAAAGSGYSVIKDAVDTVTSAYGPRKRARTGTLTRRKPSDEGTGGYSQWTQMYKSGRFGRLTGKKIDSMSLEKLVFNHRRIGPFNDYGQVFLTNFVGATGRLDLPCILFELNSCNNFINGTLTNYSPVYRMYKETSGEIGFFAENSQGADGTALDPNWKLESNPHIATSAQAYPGDNAIHKWSSLDLELWGCRNKPTKYIVQLVQFAEDVCPGPTAVLTEQAAEFWESMIKHYTYSPLAKMEDGWSKKKMKILKQYKINLDPTANYENDPDPHVKTLKLFYRFNRKSNFQWKYSNPNVLSIANMNDADWKTEGGQNRTQVHPSARIFVMIRASNFTRVNSPNPIDNTTNPSLSWVLKSCWLCNA